MNNEYELYRHKKSDTVKWIIVFVLIFILLAGTAASLAIAVKNSKDKTNNEIEELANNFTAEVKNTQYARLTMSMAATQASDNSVSKTLTATVLPVTATNKKVDWSVEWGDESNTSDISQYLTVIPDADGSTTATVTCKKAFTGTIIITVTTRENGYTASCIVTFKGIPANMVIDTSVNQSGGFYKVGIGNTYDFNVTLTNSFNLVGSQFNDFTCSVTGVGSFIVGYMERTSSTGYESWTDSLNKTVTLESLKDNFISVNFAEGKIQVSTFKSIESYYASSERLDSGRTRAYYDKFRSFVDDCYFKITITENVSGLTKTFNIRFDESIVTGVDISNGEMEF